MNQGHRESQKQSFNLPIGYVLRAVKEMKALRMNKMVKSHYLQAILFKSSLTKACSPILSVAKNGLFNT
jgi:hypothetical protein